VSSYLLVGTVFLALAAVLLWIGIPVGNGISPPFLRFEIAPLIYPPLVLAIFAIGAANLISAIIAWR
jgi:hypothetical protein